MALLVDVSATGASHHDDESGAGMEGSVSMHTTVVTLAPQSEGRAPVCVDLVHVGVARARGGDVEVHVMVGRRAP